MQLIKKSKSISVLKNPPHYKMDIFHKDLQNRWVNFTLLEQMANIGAEVGRTISWRNKNNKEMSKNAFYRALELLDFTIQDSKNINSLKEICRVREVLVDFLLGKIFTNQPM